MKLSLSRFVLFLLASTILIGGTIAPRSSRAQELIQDRVVTAKARVISIDEQTEKTIPGTDVKTVYQKITAKIIDGEERDKVVVIQNDYLNLEKDEVFYLQHVTNTVEGTDVYVVSDPYRMPTLYVLMGLFVLCTLIFGGKQGARGLVALLASFAFIGYFLLPGIINGYSPVLVSIGVSSLIIVLGSYVTHGFNKVTSTAVIGMIITILITGALAYISINTGRLTGFSSEEAVSLNLHTRGSIDFAGLLLGGILIGLLGVLYDAAIGQAVAVDELRHVGPHLPRSVIFKRALRIGREHIGALVNTLAIAYVGASMPLLLLFYTSSAGFGLLINQEIFATEIIRILIGSIGLILAVPITTWISVSMLVKKVQNTTASPAVVADELRVTEKLEHRH
jgi:uncharacterized membrane protein